MKHGMSRQSGMQCVAELSWPDRQWIVGTLPDFNSPCAARPPVSRHPCTPKRLRSVGEHNKQGFSNGWSFQWARFWKWRGAAHGTWYPQQTIRM